MKIGARGKLCKSELFIRLVITIVISHLVLRSQSRFLGSSPPFNTRRNLWNKPSQVAVTSFVETRFEAFKNTHGELSYLNQLVKRYAYFALLSAIRLTVLRCQITPINWNGLFIQIGNHSVSIGTKLCRIQRTVHSVVLVCLQSAWSPGRVVGQSKR